MNKQDKSKFLELLINLSDASYQCGMSTKLSLNEYYPLYKKHEKSLANLRDFVKDFDRVAPVEQPKQEPSFIDQLLAAMNDIGAEEGIGYELTRKESPKPAKQNEASTHENDEKLPDELTKKALSLTDDKFIGFVSDLRLQRCIYCGTMRNGSHCHCQNDE
jgi:hypothetical protein